MVYERIRWTQIPKESGSIRGTGSHFDVYAEHPIDGRITKIQWELPSSLAPLQAGSALITLSGTGEQVLTIKNVFNADWYRYVRTKISDVDGNALTLDSGCAEIISRDSIIRIVGSGFGLQTGSDGGIFKIFYY